VLKRDHGYPTEVEDRKSGLRGRLNYRGARIVEVHDDDSGHFAVPVTSADAHRYILYWRFDGEFDTYEGVRST
jgi:hypothetical protein